MLLTDHADTDTVKLPPGLAYPALVQVNDPEGDSPTFRWKIRTDLRYGAESKERETLAQPLTGYLKSSIWSAKSMKTKPS